VVFSENFILEANWASFSTAAPQIPALGPSPDFGRPFGLGRDFREDFVSNFSDFGLIEIEDFWGGSGSSGRLIPSKGPDGGTFCKIFSFRGVFDLACFEGAILVKETNLSLNSNFDFELWGIAANIIAS